MNDGAAAQIIMKRETADKMVLEPLYTIVTTASIALQPRIMMTAAYNLKESGGGFAACAICGGLTQGAGAIIWVE
jgi:acetyl-CoA C-acetyltransferase